MGLDVGLNRQTFKAAVINMFQEVKETMLKELKENIVIMTQQIEILNKEIFKKIEILEVKSNCWNEKI